MSGAPRRIAVTGANGRLGRALMAHGRDRGDLLLPWSRPELDLDAPERSAVLLDRDRPDLVIHAAAWTDVDACAREPELAMARNGSATGVLAEACAARGVALALISTNEVFGGDRTDGHGYTEQDVPAPRNPYGASKLAGERAALAASGPGPGAWIVRVAWLYGPPGNDFPGRIVAAADRLPPDEPLRVVEDEVGTPTSTRDLAVAILALLDRTVGGTFHLAPDEPVSRYGWARAVLGILRPGRAIVPVDRRAFQRSSDPPPWGVLDAGRAAAVGVRLPPWRASLARDLADDPPP
jgi:dTDP-4-dehydrorhamnose reductase